MIFSTKVEKMPVFFCKSNVENEKIVTTSQLLFSDLYDLETKLFFNQSPIPYSTYQSNSTHYIICFLFQIWSIAIIFNLQKLEFSINFQSNSKCYVEKTQIEVWFGIFGVSMLFINCLGTQKCCHMDFL